MVSIEKIKGIDLSIDMIFSFENKVDTVVS